jgi:peptidoglycan/LPS O-acetylase OafA/YrhL
VAAVAVVLFHYAPRATSGGGPVLRLVDSGYIGVSLFFVLSGFVLAYNYLDPATATMRGSAREFWWARVARVYPVYLVALFVSLPEVLDPLLARDGTGRAARAAATLVLAPALLQSFSRRTACTWNCPGWSLSVEAVFYLLFPVLGTWLLRGGARRTASKAAVAWALGIGVAAAYVILRPDGLVAPTHASRGVWLDVLKYHPLVHLPEFMVGAAAGAWFPVLQRSTAFVRRVRFVAGWVVAGTLALLAFVPSVPFVLLHTGLLAPAWATVVVGLALSQGLPGDLLGSRVAVRLGEASYALYLLHGPIGRYTELAWRRGFGAGGSPAIEVGVKLVTSLAVAFAVHAAVERPAREALRRLFPTRRRSAFSAIAAGVRPG